VVSLTHRQAHSPGKKRGNPLNKCCVYILYLPPIQWVGVKRPGREADHVPPSSAEVESAWNCTTTSPYVFMTLYLVKHRDNFTLLYFTLLYLKSSVLAVLKQRGVEARIADCILTK